MNNFHLQDVEVRDSVSRIWRQNPLLGFTGKLKCITKFYKLHCIRKAQARRVEESELHLNLTNLQVTLQVDPQNANAQERLKAVIDNLAAFEKHATEG